MKFTDTKLEIPFTQALTDPQKPIANFGETFGWTPVLNPPIPSGIWECIGNSLFFTLRPSETWQGSTSYSVSPF